MAIARALYVADLRVGPRSVLDEGLELTPQSTDPIELVIGFDGGSVEGRILNPKKLPVLVVLAPQPSRRKKTRRSSRQSASRTAPILSRSLVCRPVCIPSSLLKRTTLKNGDTIPYLSSDFLSLHENSATSVSVEKGATVGPVQLRWIAR
jgi:hypothetical protein